MAGASKPKPPKSDVQKRTINDPRFSHIQNDPRFRLPSRKDTHVKVDKRFSRMLDDEDFTKKAKVDRYGRALSSAAGKKELKKFYEFEEDDVPDQDEDVERELKRVQGLTHDPARHGGFEESSSDDDSSSEDESDIEDEEDEEELEVEADSIPTGEITRRIAVVNLDWDNIRAVDVMAVASSFCPKTGRIENVTIYPSEFGRERMEREEMEGPPKELFAVKGKSSAKTAGSEQPDEEDVASESEDDEQIKQKLLQQSTNPDANAEVDSKALRNYQLSRLRYFYAVVSCDTKATAQTLYEEMDGSEYLSSANFFDLRFIPDDTTFDDPITDKPRDQCDKVPDGYRPNEFVTDALTHSKVNLTWDQEDKGRKEVQKRAFSQRDVDDNDLQAYIGSDSDSDEGDAATDPAPAADAKQSKKDAARQKMRSLLGLPAESAPSAKPKKSDDPPAGGMQVTFTAGLTASAPKEDESVFTNKPSDVIEESTRDKYIRKEKERKARRRAKAKAAREGVELPDQDASDAAEEPAPAPDPEGDDPFDDPFFTNPSAANKAAQREARRIQHREKEAKAAAEAERSAKEREELRKIMEDEGVGGGAGGNSHFDMAAVRRQEKDAARKGKHKKQKKSKHRDDDDEVARADNFDMDVQDPRFSRLYESHEYAIDPTNPRFSGTKSMKKLLDEGRKRRDVDGDAEVTQKKKSDKGAAKRATDGELNGLVQKIKRRKQAV